MFQNSNFRNEQFRTFGALFLVVCLMHLGWSFPFFPKKEEGKDPSNVSSPKAAQEQKTAVKNPQPKSGGSFKFVAGDLKGDLHADSLKGNGLADGWDQGKLDTIRTKLGNGTVVGKAEWAEALNQVLKARMRTDDYQNIQGNPSVQNSLDSETKALLIKAVNPTAAMTETELEHLNRRFLEAIYPQQIGKIQIEIAKQSPDQVKQADLLAVNVISSRLPSAKENINDVASNVTYKSAQDLALTHPATFQEAVSDTEGGVFYDDAGNGVDSTFSLRGFNDPSAVVFLEDGVRMNEIDDNTVKLSLIPMRDVDSIQIERGSGSSIYGSGAFAGIVNVTTGQPSPKPVHLFGGMEWSSFHGLRFNQGISGTVQDTLTPLGGKLSYYFNGERDDNHGFRDNDTMRLTSFDIKTAYTLPEEEGRFYVNVKHIADAIGLPGEITLQEFNNGDIDRCNKPTDGWKFNTTTIQLGADKKFWDDRITASIMDSERWNNRNAISTYGTFTDFYYAPFGSNTPDTLAVDTKARDRDLIGQVKYDDAWWKLANESLLGVEFRRSNQHSLEWYAPNGQVQGGLPPEVDHNALYSNFGLFWRETVKLWDKVIPYFGMRHDFYWLNTNSNDTGWDPTYTYLTNYTDAISKRWDKTTLSTGVTVKPLKWADIFANYSQGFRVPTIDELLPYAGYTQTQNLKPESSNSYEAGTRLRYKDWATYKLSYFLIDIDNEIDYDNATMQNLNIAKTRRYGVEQRVDVTPIQEIKLYGGYTWTTAYVLSNGGTSSFVEGSPLGLVPANRFTLGGTACPFKQWGEPYSGLKFGLNGTFTGKQHPEDYETNQTTSEPAGKAGYWMPGYSVWNFIVSYVWKEKEIYFKVNNLFDERYYSRSYSGSSDGTSIYPAGNYTWVNPGAPREFVLGSKWEF